MSWFSFNGPIGRQSYWIATLALDAISVVLYLLFFFVASTASSDVVAVMGAIFGLLLIPASISALSFQVRRWHDLGKSGWWCLIQIIPIIGSLYAFGMLGFVPGTPDPNGYDLPSTSPVDPPS